jgi:iron-only hydrogenase group A
MQVEPITLTINGQRVKAEPGMTVLEAARQAGIHIPTLCYHRDLAPEGHCRVCLVEVEGQRALQPACVFPVWEKMAVKTNSRRVREARRFSVELILSNHPADCLNCVRNQRCELQTLARELGIREAQFEGECTHCPEDDSGYIIRDNDKCVLCRRCVRVCHGVQGVGVLGVSERGWDSVVGPAFGQRLSDTNCVNCGQCITYCPVGALREQDATRAVWAALDDPKKVVLVQTAPAVRVALGEEAGLDPGALVTGRMVAGLKRLGFDRVFDTDLAADLTIMEEGNELIARLNAGGKLPLITSCCPGWVKFAEHHYPDLLDNLSTAKSPQQMFGAIAKTYWATQARVDPADIVMVSVMPCTAKKFECARPEMEASGYRDVDHVLTTRELAQMLREAGVDITALPEEQFDDPLGLSTGAGLIFGATGGVMEAALRTAYEVITGEPLDTIDLEAVRGLEGIKSATIPVDGIGLRVAVVHGLANARKLLDEVRMDTRQYDFIEVMACPGGCLAGGGQPFPVCDETRQARAAAIYRGDREMPIRKSHENPAVQALYAGFLGEPLSEKAHHLLHTHYTPRPVGGAREDSGDVAEASVGLTGGG